MQKTDYYPCGMPTSASTAVDAQPYKYNGKEYDMMNGLNQYNYHARQYDPAVIRFNTVDSQAENYYSISPYVYCVNNTLKYTDPNGEIPIVSFVAGFIRGLAGGSSFRESIDIGWKTEINSWKLTGGLFVTDRDKSFFGKVGQIVS